MNPYIIPGVRATHAQVRAALNYTAEDMKALLIIQAAEAASGISLQQLKVKTRKAYILDVRQVIMYNLCALTRLSLKQIGRLLSDSPKGYDHTTVINAREKIRDILQSKDNRYDDIRALCERINERLLTYNLKTDSTNGNDNITTSEDIERRAASCA